MIAPAAMQARSSPAPRPSSRASWSRYWYMVGTPNRSVTGSSRSNLSTSLVENLGITYSVAPTANGARTAALSA
jgi:hypothetical protein